MPMDIQLYRQRLMIVLLGAVALLAVLFLLAAPKSEKIDEKFLKTHFLDVGQGDATYVETPDGIEVLIDGGADSNVLRVLSKERKWFDRTIDVVIATHPDKDHIGGLIDVLKKYKVDTIVISDNQNDTPTSEQFLKAVQDEDANVLYARADQLLQLGASTTIDFLFPSVDTSEIESNTASIIAQLHYGDTSFMLTGDSPKSIEKYLVRAYGSLLQSDVLKVGHHGSKTSTDETFVEMVGPEFSVISAGKDNRYGHPHSDVLDVLFENNIVNLNTFELGTITFFSDGQNVWQEE